MDPMVASPWPCALCLLAEGVSADRAFHFTVAGSACRRVATVDCDVGGHPQPSQLRGDDGRAGLDVRERLEPCPHPDRRSAGIVLDGEHEAL
jgi:hypothetical protein